MFNWLRSLFGWATRTSLSPLARQVSSPDPEVRRQAAVLLGTATEPAANAQLLLLLQDGHAPIREAAREALRQRGVDALPSLLQALSHDDANVAAPAAELLGTLALPETIEPLLAALKYSKRPVQMAARRALLILARPPYRRSPRRGMIPTPGFAGRSKRSCSRARNPAKPARTIPRDKTAGKCRASSRSPLAFDQIQESASCNFRQLVLKCQAVRRLLV